MPDVAASNPKFMELFARSRQSVKREEIEPLLNRHGGATLAFVQEVVEKQLMSKEVVCRLWADSIGYAYVDPIETVVTREALDLIPLEIARKAHVVGMYLLGGVLTVGMAEPENETLVRRLEAITQKKISPVFSLPAEIQDAIEIHYTTEEGVGETIAAFERVEGNLLENISEQDMQSISQSKSLAKILDALIYFAIKERASDIHIEPLEDYCRVRFRIDGRLQEMMQVSRSVQPALVSRLKVLCKLRIEESRFPQDGRFTMPLGVSAADFRVSFLPSQYGSKVVVRILAGAGRKEMMGLDEMLISQSILQPFRRLINSPNGIIFVTGPTGSGKTTTLYAALQEINAVDKNISTIEDPIEVRMPGITQAQVNLHIDLKFSTLLRALLRQDPDIILVGEIRDLETAKIATEAALTGHLVLSTLHTNTAVQAVIRLIEIGIEPYMVAPSIIGVLGQRLAARICEKCKQPYYPSYDLLSRFFHDADDTSVPFYAGKGCPACRKTGYHGRIAFHELVLVSEEMRSLISSGAGLRELTKAAQRLGYRPLRYDGLKKVLLGLTTIDEVEKQTPSEWAF